MKVEKNIELLDFLLEKTDYSKSKIKSLFKYKAIKINGKRIDRNTSLKKGDIIDIAPIKKIDNNTLDILYEDKDIIVVNKEAGLLTVSTIKENDKTLFSIVRKYVKSKNKSAHVFIVHRLDKDTSGIIIFAKSERIKHLFQLNWDNLVLRREYTAICEGVFEQKKGTIKNYLKQNKANNVYISNESDAKLAITHYKVIKNNSKNSLVEILLETGRKNQIRVHMSSINHPIVGDSKYGNKSSGNKLCLIANKLVFEHPINHKRMMFQLEIPNYFKGLVK